MPNHSILSSFSIFLFLNWIFCLACWSVVHRPTWLIKWVANWIFFHGVLITWSTRSWLLSLSLSLSLSLYLYVVYVWVCLWLWCLKIWQCPLNPLTFPPFSFLSLWFKYLMLIATLKNYNDALKVNTLWCWMHGYPISREVPWAFNANVKNKNDLKKFCFIFFSQITNLGQSIGIQC